MKRKRRYREKNPDFSISGRKGGRVHDFLKGWGTICEDGSILWDTWRPITKRDYERYERRSEKNKGKLPTIFIPCIKSIMPEIKASDIIGVQPMMTKYD